MSVLVYSVKTYEGGKLILEHRFFGETKGDALRIVHAHLKYDAFFRACYEGQRFGAVQCRSEARWETVT